MPCIRLEEIKSGDDNGCLWISLGYVSEDNPYDVLHIVVAKEVDEQDRRLSHNVVYLEGDDQDKSCYGGAAYITVTQDAVALSLNTQGLNSLGFSRSPTFVGLESTSGGAAAKKVFEEMAGYECGRVISTRF